MQTFLSPSSNIVYIQTLHILRQQLLGFFCISRDFDNNNGPHLGTMIAS